MEIVKNKLILYINQIEKFFTLFLFEKHCYTNYIYHLITFSSIKLIIFLFSFSRSKLLSSIETSRGWMVSN